jgi:anti-sigma factor RsiW
MHIASVRLSSGTVGSSRITQSDALVSLPAAAALARRIVGVWAREGHKVETWVIRSPGTGDSPPFWAVRSDLVNGMPSGLGRYGWEVKFNRAGV